MKYAGYKLTRSFIYTVFLFVNVAVITTLFAYYHVQDKFSDMILFSDDGP